MNWDSVIVVYSGEILFVKEKKNKRVTFLETGFGHMQCRLLFIIVDTKLFE